VRGERDRTTPVASTITCSPSNEIRSITGPSASVPGLPQPAPFDEPRRRTDWLAGRGGESRFRTAAPCVTARCGRWDGRRCEVGAGLAALADGRTPAALPACGIRARCRWWAEQGAAACRLCPLVRTDPAPAP
jgi:hypothetical protein